MAYREATQYVDWKVVAAKFSAGVCVKKMAALNERAGVVG